MIDPIEATRPAATLIFVRDGSEGVEVLVLRRSPKAKFMGSYHVFPGGAVDPEDDFVHWGAQANGFDDIEASRLLNLDQGGFAYWIAAIRECFEEAGLLLAEDAAGELARIDSPEQRSRFFHLREQLNNGSLGFRQFLAGEKLFPAFDRLAYLGHWVTPVGATIRFNTRFFVAIAPEKQESSHDQAEMVDQIWLRPKDALARSKSGELKMIAPTLKNLEMLSEYGSCASLMHHLRQPRNVPMILTRYAAGRDGIRVLLPNDYAYAEVGKLDPTGKLKASCEIIPGVPVQLSPRLRRLTAPNPSFMTGPGTNSYLLGTGDEIAIIDPGPALDQHIDLLIAQARGPSGAGRIRWILATHTHPDHSPAVARLKALTGAEALGIPAATTYGGDQSFLPDRIPRHDERLAIAGCTLRVIHTPGHASNHLCYLLEEEKILFCGDHLMQGSTVVINPPDGDMAAYLESLRLVQREDIEYLAPGHGFLMDHHRQLIDALLAHRQQREDKVLAALRTRQGRATLAELLPLAYDDVPVQIHPLAARSLLAHLIKLRSDGTAWEDGNFWCL